MMTDTFGAVMSADPNVPPEVGQMAGQAFGAIVVVAMAFMLVWAVMKGALYLWTRSVVVGERGDVWFGVSKG